MKKKVPLIVASIVLVLIIAYFFPAWLSHSDPGDVSEIVFSNGLTGEKISVSDQDGIKEWMDVFNSAVIIRTRPDNRAKGWVFRADVRFKNGENKYFYINSENDVRTSRFYYKVVGGSDGFGALSKLFESDPAISSARVNDYVDLGIGILDPFNGDVPAGYEYLPGGFGEDSYIKTTENGEIRFTVTSWPDFSDSERYITRIYCTDKTTSFFGASLSDDWDEIMNQLINRFGYDFEAETDPFERVRIDLGAGITMIVDNTPERSFAIVAEVSNREGIVF